MDFDQIAQTVMASPTDAVFAVDGQGRIIFWNPGAERIFGFVRDEAVGALLDILIPEKLRARHNTGFDAAMASGTTRYGPGDLMAVPAQRKDGTTLSVEFSLDFLRNDQGVAAGMVAVLRDVSQHYQQMRALRHELAECRADRPAADELAGQIQTGAPA